MVDITPLEIFKIIEESMDRLDMIHYAKPTELFKLLFYFYLSPKEIAMKNRFNKKALMMLIRRIEIHTNAQLFLLEKWLVLLQHSLLVNLQLK